MTSPLRIARVELPIHHCLMAAPTTERGALRRSIRTSSRSASVAAGWIRISHRARRGEQQRRSGADRSDARRLLAIAGDMAATLWTARAVDEHRRSSRQQNAFSHDWPAESWAERSRQIVDPGVDSNEPGALYRCWNRSTGISLTRIETRPSRPALDVRILHRFDGLISAGNRSGAGRSRRCMEVKSLGSIRRRRRPPMTQFGTGANRDVLTLQPYRRQTELTRELASPT